MKASILYCFECRKKLPDNYTFDWLVAAVILGDAGRHAHARQPVVKDRLLHLFLSEETALIRYTWQRYTSFGSFIGKLLVHESRVAYALLRGRFAYFSLKP